MLELTKNKLLLLAFLTAVMISDSNAKNNAANSITNKNQQMSVDNLDPDLGDFVDDEDVLTPELKSKELPTFAAVEQPLSKPKITFKKDDLEVIFGGKIRVEYDNYLNNNYLNNKIPDDIGFFKETVDLTVDAIFGEEKCGHRAVEAFLDLRMKNKWGVVGAYKSTTAAEITLDGISLGEHAHYSSRPNPWFKDAWLMVSLNKIFNSKNDKIQYFKIGWFPFQLGRGVALGSIYGAVEEALGLFSYNADASAPGLVLNGELIKNKLWYDLYYAKFEEKSASIDDTFNNTVKINHVGRRSNPYRGNGKDDELWAARLKIRPFDNKSDGRWDIEPYIYFNEASDQKVEVANDTKTQLGAYGFETRYKKNKFKIGSEIAFNYGQEKLYSIDRNKAQLAVVKTDGKIPTNISDMIDITADNSYGAGMLYKGYSHVLVNGGDMNNKSAPVNSASTGAIYNSTNINKTVAYPNGGDNNERLINKSNRIRPEYTNDFEGYMAIFDARYQATKTLKIAAELGYASGDNDPTINEINKNYHGFIGLHELYMGKRVFAPMVLGERYIPRLRGLVAGQKEVDGFRAKIDNNFTDLTYFGVGATWKPASYEKNRFKINPNLVFFWKNDDSYKYNLDTANPDNSQVSSTQKARSFLGTEISLILNYELIKDLTLGAIVSFFAPGTFYKDVKGVPIRGDFYRDKIPSDARTGLNPADYRISDDNAFWGVISLEYRF